MDNGISIGIIFCKVRFMFDNIFKAFLFENSWMGPEKGRLYET